MIVASVLEVGQCSRIRPFQLERSSRNVSWVLCFAQILHTSGINRLINRLPSNNPVRFCHDRAASTLCRLAHRSFSVPRRPHFGEPRAWSAIADSPCQATAASAGSLDRVFWVSLRKLWSGWKKPLPLVTPETVVRWHRIRFRLYSAWLSRNRCSGTHLGLTGIKLFRTIFFRSLQ